MKYIFYSSIIIITFFSSCSTSSESKISASKNDSTVFHLVNKNQILLTNSAEFKGHSSLNGASAFLIEYNKKTYAITAKHLIGADGGVEPEIKLNELHSAIVSWKMFPRIPINEITDTVVVGSEKMNYEYLDKDILILPVENKAFNELILKPNFNLPKQGDVLFFIGCPYSEFDCKQNVYKALYDSFDSETSLIICKLNQKIEFAGFSGAPLLDANGNAIGVIRGGGGGEQDGEHFIVATFIKEIEKIK